MGTLTGIFDQEKNVYFGEKITGTIQQVVARPTAEAPGVLPPGAGIQTGHGADEIEQCRGHHNNTAGNPKPPTVRRFEEIYARQLDKLWNKRWRKAKRLQRPPRPEPPKHYYRRKKARAAIPAA